MASSNAIKLDMYAPFVAELMELAGSEEQDGDAAIAAVLNGDAYAALRELVPLESRRAFGIFFTSPEYARSLLELLDSNKNPKYKVLDPACGAGDLLLAYANHLPLSSTLEKTLAAWGEVLYGIDISEELVSTTKLRIALLAKQRGNFSGPIQESTYSFPHIRCANALQTKKALSEVDLILLNPPYQGTKTPNSCSWASGKVSAAAIFVEHIVRHMGPDTRLYAILPEVLRCGSRYQKFREAIGKYVDSPKVLSLGTFDQWTDIDVFVCELRPRENALDNLSPPIFEFPDTQSSLVGDRFNVHVGPVVAYRSPKTGVLRPYLEARDASPWSEAHVCKKTRAFSGSVFDPPFVVIRRTSRPGDTHRAVGTIIKGTGPVAIENHLIVAIPKKQTVKECNALLRVLRNSETNAFLDAAMRCRHLTVQSVKDIPWSENE